jgi:hypothetical protein
MKKCINLKTLVESVELFKMQKEMRQSVLKEISIFSHSAVKYTTIIAA